jgi:hypothetical protein
MLIDRIKRQRAKTNPDGSVEIATSTVFLNFKAYPEPTSSPKPVPEWVRRANEKRLVAKEY